MRLNGSSTNSLQPIASRVSPDDYTRAGTLHLQSRLARSLGKVVGVLRDHPWRYVGVHSVAINVRPASLPAVLASLERVLTVAEQIEAQVAFESADGDRDPVDHFEAGSLHRLLARRQSGWLMRMIEEDRLTSVFQPIVAAGSRRVFGYECLLRGLEQGRLVSCRRILDVAGGSNLLFQVDATARQLALRESVRHGIDGKIFINFAPNVLQDSTLQRTFQLTRALRIPPSRVVFEIVETEQIPDLTRLAQMVSAYRAAGFGFALDDVGAGYASLTVLQCVRPDYWKIDGQLVRDVHRHPYRSVLTAKLLEAGRELGVKTIAEGVESDDECRWLEAHGADYLQGNYLGRPAAPPPRVDVPIARI